METDLEVLIHKSTPASAPRFKLNGLRRRRLEKEDSVTEKKIYVTDSDLQRLKTLLHDNWRDRREDVGDLNRLDYELERASVVTPKEVSKDVVTMNSRVRLRDLDSGDAVEFSLVYPSQPYAAGSDHLAEMTVSVLAPIGTAILGNRVGDSIEWEVPAGVRRLKIEKVLFQPEAAGRLDL
jgi:regulator of nucleoside diphosphate kinase